MIFTEAELKALASDRPRLGVFFKLSTSPIVRVWLGIGPFRCKPGITTFDAEGGEYKGFGHLVETPALRQLLNGASARVEFTLSGVSQQIVDLALSEADVVRQKAVQLGLGAFDEEWRLIGDVHPYWRGTAEFMTPTIVNAAAPGGQQTRTVKLSVGTLTTGKRRPGLSYWVDSEQQALHPGDRGCERTMKYSQTIQKAWPRN